MKLDVDVNEIVLSNAGATGEFKIRNSAKAFKILSDGLYSNKIRAIVRELSCNAVDSHTAAGTSDRPFDVHLPSVLEPWFAIRDYGTGLNGDQVTNIYTTYFESTKTASNDFIGALGLGSKSPFSYTENFTVTAIKDGVKRIYSAFINESGVPSIAQMGEMETNEPAGVEVKFSVTNRNDYYTWRLEACSVYMYFKLKPNVLNVEETFEIRDPAYKERDIIPGVHLVGGYERQSIAVMGNIAYPISAPNGTFGNLNSLLECGLVLGFGIGELDFAASREQLSYVPLTINSIKKKLEDLNKVLESHLAARADAIENLWERAVFLHKELHDSRLYSSAVQLYARRTKFDLIDVDRYCQLATFKLPVEDTLKKDGIVMQNLSCYGSFCSAVKPYNDYVSGGQYISCHVIDVSADAVFVLNDLKTGALSRVRYHFNGKGKRRSIYILNNDAKDPKDREPVYEAFLKKIKNPPTVLKASELEKPAARVSTGTQGVLVLRPSKSSYADNKEFVWEPVTIDPNDKKTKYAYVYLNGNISYGRDDKTELNAKGLMAALARTGRSDLADIRIYGVRKNSRDIIKGKNWVWAEDVIRGAVAKITDEDIASYFATEMLDTYQNRVYNNADVLKYIPATSPYAMYLTKISKIRRALGNVTDLVGLCSQYGNKFEIAKIKEVYIADRDATHKRYPLIRYITNTTIEPTEVADYINTIDKTEGTKND